KHLQFIGPAVLAYLLHSKANAKPNTQEPNNPWAKQNAWTLNAPFMQQIKFKIPDDILEVHVQHMEDQIFITSKHINTPISIRGELKENALQYELNGQRHQCMVKFFDDKFAIFQNGFTEIYQA